MSLRFKYLFAAFVSVVIPLLGYLLLDALWTRSFMIKEQAESLRLVADLLRGSLDMDLDAPPVDVRQLLERFAKSHPDLEVMVLDQQSDIMAATRNGLIGRVWREPGIARVLSGDTDFHWATMEHHGVPVLDVTVPWKTGAGQTRGAIHLARNLTVVQAQITRVQIRHTVFVTLVALLVGTFLSVLTYKLVILRLARLDGALRDLIPARPDTIVTPRPGAGDEIDHLSAVLHALVGDLTATAGKLEGALREKDGLLTRVEGFNEELEREIAKTREELLAVQRELVRAEHLSTIGQLSAGLAHELRNPLFIIRASAESLARHLPEPRRLTSDIIEEVDRVDDIITRLLDLGRPLNVEHDQVALSRLLAEVDAQVLKAVPGDKQLQLRLECPDELSIAGDYALLRQAFINLVTNACESIARTGQVEVSARQVDEKRIEVRVKDNGQGISRQDLPRVFEPFFTRKEGGTGFGLAAVQKIFDLHDATVSVESREGEGTEVVVLLPGKTTGADVRDRT